MSSIAAVVLAAGESTRFGEPKQRILLPLVLEKLALALVDEIVVVEGAYSLEPWVGEDRRQDVRVVHARDWGAGPGASLRAALSALGDEVEAAVVVLADGPELSPATVERVLDVWRSEGGIIAASYGGSRGHPLVLGRDSWDDVPDGGLHGRPAKLVPCDDLGAPGDVDTPADLHGG
jgi:CTP:molybdopterin cytidylyltransferase MocA